MDGEVRDRIERVLATKDEICWYLHVEESVRMRMDEFGSREEATEEAEAIEEEFAELFDDCVGWLTGKLGEPCARTGEVPIWAGRPEYYAEWKDGDTILCLFEETDGNPEDPIVLAFGRTRPSAKEDYGAWGRDNSFGFG